MAQWGAGIAAVAAATGLAGASHYVAPPLGVGLAAAAGALPLVAAALIFRPFWSASSDPGVFFRWRRGDQAIVFALVWGLGAVFNFGPFYSTMGLQALGLAALCSTSGVLVMALLRPTELTLDGVHLGLTVGGKGLWTLDWKEVTVVRLITRNYRAPRTQANRTVPVATLQVLGAPGRGGIVEFWYVKPADVDRVAAELRRQGAAWPQVKFIDDRDTPVGFLPTTP